MATYFSRQRADFPSSSGGPQYRELTFDFISPVVRSAEAAISGFRAEFTRADHYLHRLEINAVVTEITNNNKRVKVLVTFALRDNSGAYDDPYEGYVDVMLMIGE